MNRSFVKKILQCQSGNQCSKTGIISKLISPKPCLWLIKPKLIRPDLEFDKPV